MLNLTIAKETVIHEWERESDGEEIEEVVVASGDDEHL